MNKGKARENYQQVISMEEYLNRRRQIRESEKQRSLRGREQNSGWIMAELYV